MKKNAKKKIVKVSGKRSKAAASDGPELPSLVDAMMKLAERLGVLEQKMDQVLGRVSSLPSEIRNAAQSSQRMPPSQPFQQSSRPPQTSSIQVPPMPQHSQPPIYNSASSQGHGQAQGQSGSRRERPLFKVICADCKKNCEIPFKPTEDRPVYCKECFSARKAHRAPLNIGRSTAASHLNKKAGFTSTPVPFRSQGLPALSGNAAALKHEKQKPAVLNKHRAKPGKKRS